MGESVPDQRGSSAPDEVVGHWLTNSREIAARFGLAGPDAGRSKAQQAGWGTTPGNHRSDPTRVRAP
jgi:hypothetical protein